MAGNMIMLLWKNHLPSWGIYGIFSMCVCFRRLFWFRMVTQSWLVRSLTYVSKGDLYL